MVALTGGMFLSGTTTPRLGIDLAGGTSITLTAREQPGEQNAVNETSMATAAGIIERRVNGLGVSEAEVQTQGDKNIVVNIPQGTNEKQAREQVGTTASLSFRPVITSAPVSEKPSGTPSPSASSDDAEREEGKGDPGPDETADDDRRTTEPSEDERDGAQAEELKSDPSSSPSASPSASPSSDPETSPDSSDTAGIPVDVADKLKELDCSTAAARAETSRRTTHTKADEYMVACDTQRPYKYALGPVAVHGQNVDDAGAVYDSQRGQGWIVNMSFDEKGSNAFAEVTGELARKPQPQNQFAIVLDGEVVSAPSVSERLAGDAQISGNFTQQSAEELANILSYGALPLTFEESSVTTISPSLGSDQLRAGLIAGAIGLVLVVAYLIFYYRLLGLVAIASLVAAAILTYTIMTLLGPMIGFALSLPAVCGAIVAIGITADSFIVYFERVRDEIREGRGNRSAITRAWPSARRTIVVSDVVSVLAAVVLFIVSVGSVRGFAFVLGLTTVLDLAVVFLLTKPLMSVLTNRPYFARGGPWSGLNPKQLGVQPPLRGRGRRIAAKAAPKEA